MSHPTYTVVFDALFDNVTTPTRGTVGSAGYDVYAHLTDRTIQIVEGTHASSTTADGRIVIPPGARALIPLGFRASLPPGIEAQLRLRSSAAFKRGLIMPNAPATIDPDYPGEWMVLVANTLTEPVTVEHGERIAQIIFARFETVTFAQGQVGVSSDRVGGFGSTGS